MASARLAVQDGSSFIPLKRFQSALWTLCAIATLFLVSRFAVRMLTKGRLMVNDYLLVVALPALYIGAGLLQSSLSALYLHEGSVLPIDRAQMAQPTRVISRLTASIEMLWFVVYCVKFCFLAQFKFHKPLYAYISVYLTRYYWSSISICSASLVFTLIQPIILCPNKSQCRYFQSSSTVAWETSVTVIDIVTDLLVIMIPIQLIHMANFTRSNAIINASFKSLSIFNIAIAATRLALQYDAENHRIEYIAMAFWLFVEATVALIMASISSWRIIVIDHLAERRTNARQHDTHKFWSGARRGNQNFTETPNDRQQESLSDVHMLAPTRFTSTSPVT